MLSKIEREYIEDIKSFKEKRGKNYAQVTRHRIRKKAKRCIRDLITILEKDDWEYDDSKRNQDVIISWDGRESVEELVKHLALYHGYYANVGMRKAQEQREKKLLEKKLLLEDKAG